MDNIYTMYLAYIIYDVTRGWCTNISCTPIIVLSQSGQTRALTPDFYLKSQLTYDRILVILHSRWY